MFKLIAILTFVLSNVLQARPLLPLYVTDFNIYVKDSIAYSSSDFQGVTGAGNSITLTHFSILDLLEQAPTKSKASVVTKRFELTNGNVFHGDVVAQDSTYLTNAQVLNGEIYSRYIDIQQGGFSRGPYANTNYNFPNLNLYSEQIDETLTELESLETIARRPSKFGSFQSFSARTDGKLINVFKADNLVGNILFDAGNDSREYFIVLLNNAYETQIKNKYFKLINGAKAENILLVYLNPGKLTLSTSGTGMGDTRTGIPASIFAPKADIHFYNGLLTGAIFANSLSGLSGNYTGGQINNGQFICFEYPTFNRYGNLDFSRCVKSRRQNQRQTDSKKP